MCNAIAWSHTCDEWSPASIRITFLRLSTSDLTNDATACSRNRSNDHTLCHIENYCFCYVADQNATSHTSTDSVIEKSTLKSGRKHHFLRTSFESARRILSGKLATARSFSARRLSGAPRKSSPEATTGWLTCSTYTK